METDWNPDHWIFQELRDVICILNLLLSKTGRPFFGNSSNFPISHYFRSKPSNSEALIFPSLNSLYLFKNPSKSDYFAGLKLYTQKSNFKLGQFFWS